MVEQDRARGRAAAWRPWVAPWVAAGRRPALAWPDGLSDFARQVVERVRSWIAAEVGPGRLVPWLAIAFGCGIAIYFALDREPAPWAVGLLLAAAVAATVLSRHRPFAFPLAMGAAALAAGLAAATVKRVIIAHPVLAAALWNVDIAGFVEVREERERSDRIVVRVERISAPRLEEPLERVRVSVRKGSRRLGACGISASRIRPSTKPDAPIRLKYISRAKS
jgi:competence protein ComEC